MTHDQAAAKARELRELRELEASPGYRQFVLPRIEKARGVHLAECASLVLTPEKRAEHIQAYHLALELLQMVPLRIKKLQEELGDFQRKTAGDPMPMGVSDALS